MVCNGKSYKNMDVLGVPPDLGNNYPLMATLRKVHGFLKHTGFVPISPCMISGIKEFRKRAPLITAATLVWILRHP
jgi:hypothetical protein